MKLLVKYSRIGMGLTALALGLLGGSTAPTSAQTATVYYTTDLSTAPRISR
ncbi:MAG: hypothetical protein GAK28_03481 [Luteibacter sp.]|uniref:hypothetical protein n=1 Tax=Luteibacter sp. TaxID=1886636 RepID=UPI0013849FE1|nr:hypothetical protein [Luteibacter sp.]KAF1005229.1 MAG: hypothetical protein GAK28_03481 [Luteibacter sp.]